MGTLNRIRVTWTNFTGGPGVSTFYQSASAQSTPVVSSLQTFFEAIKTMIPAGTVITVPGDGDKIDEFTGTLNGAWSVGAALTTTGSGTGAYAGPAGAVIRWKTGQIKNGRRLQGRTFIVPLTNGNITGMGKLSGTAVSALQAAATALHQSNSGNWYVWGRPGPAGQGQANAITSAQVPDLVAVLRSRRDA